MMEMLVLDIKYAARRLLCVVFATKTINLWESFSDHAINSGERVLTQLLSPPIAALPVLFLGPHQQLVYRATGPWLCALGQGSSRLATLEP